MITVNLDSKKVKKVLIQTKIDGFELKPSYTREAISFKAELNDDGTVTLIVEDQND